MTEIDNPVRRRRGVAWRGGGIAVVMLVVLAAGAAFFFWRQALWAVGEVCVADQRLAGSPLPCAEVDSGRGFAVLRLGRLHTLLFPTVPIEGIESPALVADDAENYFADAWQARSYLQAPGGGALPDDIVGMAVNSAAARTQDQLHIHIACLRPDVVAALAKQAGLPAGLWAPQAITLANRPYRILRIDGPLDGANPFQLVAAGLPALGGDMADQTLVVAGAKRTDGGEGFYVLASQSRQYAPAIGEHLLDYQCRAATAIPPVPAPAAR